MGYPSFASQVRMQPVALEAKISGGFKVGVSAISANVSAIPIRLAIPFLKTRRSSPLPLLAVIGPFHLRLKPFNIELMDLDFHVDALLGKGKGLQGEIKGEIGCHTEMEMEGELPVKLSSVCLNLAEEEGEAGKSGDFTHLGSTNREGDR